MYKIFIPILAVVFTLSTISCKKTIAEKIEEKQTDYVVLAMTNGMWKMSWFKEDGVTLTAFDNYEFKYYENYTVDGIAPSGVTVRGNWTGNGATLTTTCDFPMSAGAPLTKINGSWKITRNSWTFVEAQQINGTIIKTMRLDKK